MERILVVAAHPDDEILGCGGTIKKLINEGNIAYSLILSDGVTSRFVEVNEETEKQITERHKESLMASKKIGYHKTFFSSFPDNKFDSVPLLEITKTIEKYLEIIEPTIIFTHHNGDLNIDHRKVFEAVITASRPVKKCTVKEIYCFETLSSTEWNFSKHNDFTPNYFVNVEKTFKDKIEAIKCYTSELREYPHPRSVKALEVAAKKWGTVVGYNFVEAFELVRKIVG